MEGRHMFEIEYADIKNNNLNDLVLEHGLVIVRNAELQMQDFENIANGLGRLLKTHLHAINENRNIQELSNNELLRDGDVDWHNDWSYGRGNFYGTMLYNVKNAHLSETWFVDTSKVPEWLKDEYKDCVGYYWLPQFDGEVQAFNTDSEIRKCFTEKQLKILEKYVQQRPFVQNHFKTGEELLYCSLGTLQKMDNEREVDTFRKYCDENNYKHQWKEGDILLWDNLKMIHKRFAFAGDRMLWRTQFTI